MAEPTITAEVFARQMHNGQIYEGHGDYANTHLTAVVQIVRDFGFVGVWEEAAWLHDVIEDTDATHTDLADLFGCMTADIAWACTGEGANRDERNASIYAKIAAFPSAAVVKLADRIANVEAAAGTRFLEKYRRELPGFEDAIRPHVPAAMWLRLERAFEDDGIAGAPAPEDKE